jgi:hypothetical protein
MLDPILLPYELRPSVPRSIVCTPLCLIYLTFGRFNERYYLSCVTQNTGSYAGMAVCAFWSSKWHYRASLSLEESFTLM